MAKFCGFAVTCLLVMAALSCKSTSRSGLKEVFTDDSDEAVFEKLPYTKSCSAKDLFANRPQCVDLQREVYFGRKLDGTGYYFAVGNPLRFEDKTGLQYRNVLKMDGSSGIQGSILELHAESDSIMVVPVQSATSGVAEGRAQIILTDPGTKARVGRASLVFNYKSKVGSEGDLPGNIETTLLNLKMSRDNEAVGEDEIRIKSITLNELCSGIFVNNCILDKAELRVKTADFTIEEPTASPQKISFVISGVKLSNKVLGEYTMCWGAPVRKVTSDWGMTCSIVDQKIKVEMGSMTSDASIPDFDYIFFSNYAFSVKDKWSAVRGVVKKNPEIKGIKLYAINKEYLGIDIEHSPIDDSTFSIERVSVGYKGFQRIESDVVAERSATKTTFKIGYFSDYLSKVVESVTVNNNPIKDLTIVENKLLNLYRFEKIDFKVDGNKLSTALTFSPDIGRISYVKGDLSCNNGELIKTIYGFITDNSLTSTQYKLYDLTLNADELPNLKSCILKEIQISEANAVLNTLSEEMLKGKIVGLP